MRPILNFFLSLIPAGFSFWAGFVLSGRREINFPLYLADVPVQDAAVWMVFALASSIAFAAYIEFVVKKSNSRGHQERIEIERVAKLGM